MNPHPNATAGGLGASVGILIVFLLGELGVSVPEEAAAAIATVCATVLLLIPGRKGTPGA